MKIMVLEDEPLIRKVIVFKLKKDGYIVLDFPNGKEGIDNLDETYDLVITDLMMPYKLGKEVLAHCVDNYPNIPVIVLTSLSQEDNVVELLEMGASDYIKKPFSPEELSIRVKKVLKNK
jgi:DNA-binding response OmpR family regulator